MAGGMSCGCDGCGNVPLRVRSVDQTPNGVQMLDELAKLLDIDCPSVFHFAFTTDPELSPHLNGIDPDVIARAVAREFARWGETGELPDYVIRLHRRKSDPTCLQ